MERSKAMSRPVKDTLVTAICWLCMALFLYTAYAKITDHDRFLKGLIRVNLINSKAPIIAYAVPAVEVAVALLLLIPATVKTGLYLFIAVMSAFTVYIAAAMIWEKKLPCHCGGAIEKLTWSQHIWFNFAFIAIAAMGLRLIQTKHLLKN